MASKQDLMYSPVAKIEMLPGHNGILMALSNNGDAYFVNLRMQLLKHTTLEEDNINVISFLDAEPNAQERYFFTAGSSLSLWAYTTDHRLFDISTVCDEDPPEIELRRINTI